MTDNNMTVRYISRIRIENFQDHKDTEFLLKPGINIIIGSSDAGKSAILRAINWVFHNQPRNTSFVRHGADEARVTIWFNDGTEVCRIKGKQRNAITIQKSNGETMAFEKIGNTLPPEALEVLGNPPIDERHGPISYSEQMSPYFLVSLTPTEMPRSISELTGINDFEEAAQMLGKKSRQSDRQIKEGQERLDQYTQELEMYADLDERLTNFTTLEEKANKIQAYNSRINDIDNLLSKYETVMVTGRKASRKYKRAKAIATYTNNLVELQKWGDEINEVETLYRSYLDKVSKENKAKNRIAQLKSIASESIMKKVTMANKIVRGIDSMKSLLMEYDKVNEKEEQLRSECKKWNDKLNNMQVEYDNIAQEMKEQGLWCDVCDRPLAIDQCNKEE